MEGDSTLATQVCKKLQQGIEVANISDNWRLNKIMQRIKNNIDRTEGLHFHAIRRNDNKLADKLVNEGTVGSLRLRSKSWHELEEGGLCHHYEAINVKDNQINEE